MRKGATMGAGIGLVGSSSKLIPSRVPKFVPGSKKYNSLYEHSTKRVYTGTTNPDKQGNIKKTYNEVPGRKTSSDQKFLFIAGTTLLGAALGSVVGMVKTLNEKWSQKHTNQRLTKPLERELKYLGYKEGQDYTFDPKKANELPTKVCIVLSSASGELQTVINSIDDKNLKNLVNKIVKQSGGRIQTSTQNNRFNEITITTEKNASKNVKQVSSIIKSFVENKYPVYIVEVG
jgi:uncharacterized protein (UPF0333 family)